MDIVNRLKRNPAPWTCIKREAAQEIETLREKVVRLEATKMTYAEAFARAVDCNAVTGARIRVYRNLWDGSYFSSPYQLPMPHQWAVLIGEVGRRTGR